MPHIIRGTITYTAFSFAAAGFIIGAAVFAQTGQSDIPENLQPLANELGCASKELCAAAFNSNVSKGIEMAEKYNLYDTTQKKLAKSFRDEVLTQLAGTTEDNFDQKIVELAKAIVKNKPTLAKQFGINTKNVTAAETIITEVKNAGVKLDTCMRPAETLSREELVSCLNASRRLAEQKNIVSVYIPEEKLARADNALNLEEAAKRGEYKELGVTADEIGATCLKPESPTICDEIAKKFFGDDGFKELQEARSKVVRTEDYYKKTIGSYVLTTPTGERFTGKENIKNACDNAFKNRKIELVRACGDFAVKNGFAQPEEVSRSMKVLESVTTQGADFGNCIKNPEQCVNILPTEFKNEFGVMTEIDAIMRKEIGFDPMQCERAGFDPAIGQKCFEGSKRAISQLEAIAGRSAEAQRVVNDIKQHIEEGSRLATKQQEFGNVLATQGGPGGCKSAQECNTFCSNPANSLECLSFGAKQGAFKEADVAQRIGQYTERLAAPPMMIFPQVMQAGTYQTGQMPYYPQGYPAQQPGNYPSVQPGQQQPYPTQQYPNTGYYQPYPMPAPPTGPTVGPSPECFTAIQSGDFEKAKEICNMPQTPSYPAPYPGTQYPTPYPVTQPGQNVPPYPYPGPQICPQVYASPCPPGQHREGGALNGCPIVGACVPDQPTPTQPPQPGVPPTTGGSCSGGQTWCTSPSGYGGWCQMPPCPSATPYPSPTQPPMPSGASHTWKFRDGSTQFSSIMSRTDQEYRDFIARTDAETLTGYFGGWKPGAGNSSPENWQNFGIPMVSQTPGTSPTMPPSGSGSCPSGQYWYTPPGGGAGYCMSSGSTPPSGSGCRSYYSESSCSAASCVWYSHYDGTHCDDAAHGQSSAATCPSGQYWYMPPGGGAGYCQTSGTGSCASGQYWYTPPGGGPGYCQSSGTTPPTSGSCTGGQTWCPSSSGSGGWCQMPPCPSSTPPPSGSSCAAWEVWCPSPSGYGGWCQAPPCSSTYTPPPSGSSCTGGQVLCQSASGSGTWCQMPPCPSSGSTSCPSGQYWYMPSGGGAGYCQTSGSGSCPSGQYWYTPPGGGAGYCQSSGTTPPTSGSCTGGQTWCPSSSGSGGWCQMPPCPSSGSTSCPSGQYWYMPSGGGAGYCMSSGSTPPSSCSGSYSGGGYACNYSTCPNGCTFGSDGCPNGCMSTPQTSSCGTGQYWCAPTYTGGSGWCQSSPCPSSTPPPSSGSSCSSDQVWCTSSSGGSGWCQMPPCPSSYTPPSGGSSSCPSGQYWYTPPSGGSGYCMSSGSTPPPSGSGSCSSDQVWCTSSSGGSGWCQMPPCPSSTPPPPTSDPATQCSQSGGTWDGSMCNMPPPPPSPPPEPPPPTTMVPLSQLLSQLNSIFHKLTELLGLMRVQ